MFAMAAGVAYIAYRLHKGSSSSSSSSSGAAVPLGELAEVSDTARELAEEAMQQSPAQTLLRPAATLGERVYIASLGDTEGVLSGQIGEAATVES